MKKSKELMLERIGLFDVQKGDVIPEARIKHLYSQTGGPPENYPFFVINIKEAIMFKKWEDGSPVVVRQVKGDLHVLQDDSASNYCYKRFENGIASADKYNQMMRSVDTENLSPEVKESHERATFVMQAQIDAINKKRNRLGLRKTYELATAQLRSLDKPSPDDF